MKILFRLLTLFMTVPVVELALLLQVAQWTGFWPTVGIILATAVAGSYLAKREGLSAWNRLQGRLSKGGLPGDELLDAVIILVAGAFLITPGVLTDLVGFTGLIPLTRGWIRRMAKRRLTKAMREGRLQTSFGAFGGAAGPFGAESGEASPEAQAPTGGRDDSAVGGTPTERGPAPKQENSRASARPADQNGAPNNEAPGGSSEMQSSETQPSETEEDADSRHAR